MIALSRMWFNLNKYLKCGLLVSCLNDSKLVNQSFTLLWIVYEFCQHVFPLNCPVQWYSYICNKFLGHWGNRKYFLSLAHINSKNPLIYFLSPLFTIRPKINMAALNPIYTCVYLQSKLLTCMRQTYIYLYTKLLLDGYIQCALPDIPVVNSILLLLEVCVNNNQSADLYRRYLNTRRLQLQSHVAR